ncbi:unnamed protein product [Triticum turgidum subsp. durum]|uniref:Uncharacterized protein n=1 Tax=Triticum turgidum subsp. durum TaxID=4567 RepID=A0A9R1R491_TRITD|nr:unnamed protein product [Triticum turgidum subsp. durum]
MTRRASDRRLVAAPLPSPPRAAPPKLKQAILLASKPHVLSRTAIRLRPCRCARPLQVAVIHLYNFTAVGLPARQAAPPVLISDQDRSLASERAPRGLASKVLLPLHFCCG